MLSTIRVIKACTVRVFGLYDKNFVANEIVNYGSQYYYPLLWAGLATETGEESPSIDPVPPPEFVRVDRQNAQDNWQIKWDGPNQRWVVADILSVVNDIVATQLSVLTAGAPEAFNTLKELSDALAANASSDSALAGIVNGKAPINNPTFTGTVGGITKSMVGLGNVDNTSDANKPVSTAQQTALNAKENTLVAGTTAQYYRGDKTWQPLNQAAVGLGNVNNTSDAAKPVSTAQQSALNLKQDLINIAEKVVTAPPTAYPLGTSIFSTSDSSWPGPVAGGIVVTEYYSADRARQRFTAKNASREWLRTANTSGTDGWNPWREMAGIDSIAGAGTGDVAGPVNSVTDGQLVAFDGTSGKMLKGFTGTIPQGDVVGPAGAVDNQLVLFNGTTGKLVKAATQIPDGGLPGRIQSTASGAPVSDCDTALSTGTYWADTTAVNTPVSGQAFVLRVVAPVSSLGFVIQTATQYSLAGVSSGADTATYQRRRGASTWGSWYRVYSSQAELDTRYFQNANVLADANFPDRLKATPASLVTDLNSAIDSGWYKQAAGNANAPSGSSHLMVFVISYSSSAKTQTAYGATDGRSWIRSMSASTWSAWIQLTDSTGALLAVKPTQGGAEPVAALSGTSGTVTANASAANLFYTTPTAAITLAFSNLAASGVAQTYTIEVNQGATAYAVNMPASGTIKWMSPQPTQTANKTTLYTFYTRDGGSTWFVSATVQS